MTTLFSRALLVLTLLAAGCATTSEKIPSFSSKGHWKVEKTQRVLPGIDVEISTEDFDLTYVEHVFQQERRRKRHFAPLEWRWTMYVLVHGPWEDDNTAIELGVENVTAILPNGAELVLPHRGRNNDGWVKFQAPYNEGEDLAPGPVAFLIAGHRIDVPAN